MESVKECRMENIWKVVRITLLKSEGNVGK